jgi:putative heme transporter
MPGLSDRLRSAGQDLSQVGPEIIPGWMLTAGIGGWLVAGMAAAIAIVGWFFAASASVTVPLVLAMVIGMIGYPLCEKMTSRGLPRTAAAAVVLLLLLAIAGFVVWITVAGVIAQWPSISANFQKGVAQIAQQLAVLGFDPAALKTAVQQAQASATTAASTGSGLTTGLLSSLGSALTAGISGLFSAAFSLFIVFTLLFYVLSDFPTMAAWVGRHMGGLRPDIGQGIVEDAVKAMRGYFRATTISGIAVATVIGIAMLLMGVPLAGAVAVVTFLTCYIPYFGAIVSGAFAFVIALGSNGFPTALALLAIVLITQNVLQTIINAKVMGDSLNLHPLVVLVVTMLGGIFAGLLGAALGAPLAALFIMAGKRLSAAFEPAEEPAEEPA